MKKRLLPMFLACCMLFSLLAVCAQADGAPLYVEYLDGDGVDAMPGESGDGWSFQGRGPAVLTLNNFQGKYIALQFDVPMYGNMEISLTNGSVNTAKHLLSSLDGELTIRGNGMLLIKSDDNDPAVDLYESTLKIAKSLRMIGGTKEGDKNPLTIRDGKAVTSDGKAATYVVFVPSGSEGDIPAFPSDGTEQTPAEPQKPTLPDNPGNIKWNLSDDGTFTVSGTGAMENYQLTGHPWFEKASSIKRVIIENGVTTVGDNAFYGTDNLESVILPNTLTGIGDSAFSSSGLASISIPDSVTFIGERAFSYTNISNFQISKNVAYIGERAFETVELLSVTVDSGNQSYSSKDGVLFNKDKTTLIAFPSSKKEAYEIPASVKTIANDAFAYSMSSKITIPASVTTIGESAFRNCFSIKSITIPKSVSSIGSSAFHACHKLESIFVDSENNHYASRDGVLFDKNMTTLINYPCNKQGTAYAIPNGVTTIALGDWDGFSDCKNLTALEIPVSVTTFYYCALYSENLKDIYYGGNKTQWNNVVNSKEHRSSDELQIINSFNMHYGSSLPTNLASAVSTNPTQFSDVPADAYYADAVKWAVAQGVTNGVSATNFAPAETCTRGQVATFLWRAKGCPEPQTTENPFTDVDPSSAFYKAILWAAESGITTGTSETTFSPGNPCTRAHVVTFLWRSQGKPAASGAAPLADSLPQGYYTDAVRWADSAGLLNGTGEAFAPSALCPRADIVTYLYRVLT